MWWAGLWCKNVRWGGPFGGGRGFVTPGDWVPAAHIENNPGQACTESATVRPAVEASFSSIVNQAARFQCQLFCSRATQISEKLLLFLLCCKSIHSMVFLWLKSKVWNRIFYQNIQWNSIVPPFFCFFPLEQLNFDPSMCFCLKKITVVAMKLCRFFSTVFLFFLAETEGLPPRFHYQALPISLPNEYCETQYRGKGLQGTFQKRKLVLKYILTATKGQRLRNPWCQTNSDLYESWNLSWLHVLGLFQLAQKVPWRHGA